MELRHCYAASDCCVGDSTVANDGCGESTVDVTANDDDNNSTLSTLEHFIARAKVKIRKRVSEPGQKSTEPDMHQEHDRPSSPPNGEITERLEPIFISRWSVLG